MDRLVDKKTISESELTEEQQELSKNYLPDLTDLDVTRKEVTNALRKTRLMVFITLLWIYMDESSKFPISCHFSIPILKLLVCLQNSNVKIVSCLLIDKLIINLKSYNYNLSNSVF